MPPAPLRAVGEQVAKLKLAEPGQRQVEAAELQFSELEAEEFAVPSSDQRECVREFFAYGISRSIGQRSSWSAGHASHSTSRSSRAHYAQRHGMHRSYLCEIRRAAPV